LTGLAVKDIRYKSHKEFLEKCLQRGVVPKGFEIKWDIQLDVHPDLQEQCTKIKKDASLKLVQVAIEGCTRKIDEVQASIRQCEVTSGKTVSRVGLRSNGKSLTVVENQLKETKRKKLLALAPGESSGNGQDVDQLPLYRSANSANVSEGIDWFDMTPNVSADVYTHQEDVQVPDRQELVRPRERPNVVSGHRPPNDDPVPLHGNSRTIASTGDTSNQMVTNLSDKTLTNAQMTLLSKGFNFIPAREKIDLPKLLSDLSEWERRMRLKEFFHGRYTGDYEEPEPWKKKKSYFTPESGRDRWLDTYIEVVKNDVLQGLNKSCEMNISDAEQVALKDLLNDEGIIIRPADKGSGAVIANTSDYREELIAGMEKSESYRETEEDGTKVAMRKVNKIAKELCRKGHIDSDLKKYLVPKYSRSGKLKGNPKLHKPGNPYRHIVSGVGTATERMAEVAEKELEQFVVESESYVKDTTDFLRKIRDMRDPVPQDAILFCFDVTKLYPSIPKVEGLTACKEALDARHQPDIPTEQVLEMIETVLENNNFSFCGKDYIQIDGVAIGSKLGKNYACAYMRKWDQQLVADVPDLLFYKRFIDDGFGVWTGSVHDLLQFQQKANSIHGNIQVELRWSITDIEFLDMSVRKDGGKLKTDLYVKPTDKHVYVAADSCHPNHVKKAIPYGLGVRLKRICDETSDYERHRKELHVQLKSRGYKSGFIERQLKRVDALDRTDLLNRKKPAKVNTGRVPLVVTYSKTIPNVHNIINKNMRVLHRSERMRNVFQKPPLVAYRRDRNLGDMLVHGKLNRIQKRYDHGFDCGENCRVCDVLTTQTSVKSTDSRNSYVLNTQEFKCKTRNVVYMIYCGHCDKPVYVGETERTLGERLKEHLADVRLRRDTPVSTHFARTGHGVDDFKAAVLERMCDESRNYRLIKERDWIRRLNTEVPSGLNTKCSLRFL
jgi:hypothetical protein